VKDDIFRVENVHEILQQYSRGTGGVSHPLLEESHFSFYYSFFHSADVLTHAPTVYGWIT